MNGTALFVLAIVLPLLAGWLGAITRWPIRLDDDNRRIEGGLNGFAWGAMFSAALQASAQIIDWSLR